MSLLRCTACCLTDTDLVRESKGFSKLIRGEKLKLVSNDEQSVDALMLLL